MAADMSFIQKALTECTSEELEMRKVRALEKTSRAMEGILEWLEDIDKDDWSERIQWYLSLFKERFIDPASNK